MSKIILVRSPEQLIKQNLVGYGWKSINFSSFDNFSSLLEFVKNEKIKIGRQRKQMERFFQLISGDIVVVPTYRAIVIGTIVGEKSHADGIDFGHNRISIKYFSDEYGNAIKIPRDKLTQGLQSRLKIRMTVASLAEFSNEVMPYISMLKKNKKFDLGSVFKQKEDSACEVFKKSLLANLINGDTFLKSGGYGFEKLIKEMMEIEGYTAKIDAKNKTSDISDVDITAIRNDPLSSNRVLIQAKHHKGVTSAWGIKQLIAVEDDEHHDKWLITTGEVAAETKKFAEDNVINVMNGKQFIDWVYSRVEQLSPLTKESLGISIMPQII